MKKRIISHPLMALIVASVLLSACDKKDGADEKVEEPIRAVKVMEVSLEKSEKLLSFPAVLQAQKLAALAFGVSGEISSVTAKGAQRVNQGDVLAKLDQRDFITNLNSAKAQYDNAPSVYQRAQRLILEDAISSSALDDRKTQFDVAKAQWEAAEKALDDTILTAPYSGIVSKVSVEVNQIIKTGDAAVAILGDGRFEATINLPASFISKAGKRKDLPRTNQLILDVAPDREIPVDFDNISLDADPSSQTYAATFSFNVPDDLVVLPGMTAILRLHNNATTEADIQIPLTAIVIEGDEKYVWIIEDMKVSKRLVILKDGVGESMALISGLSSGDMIVSAGISSLSEGMKVRPWSK